MHKTRLPSVIRTQSRQAKPARRPVVVRAEGNTAYIDIYGDIGPSESGESVLASDILGNLRKVGADTIELRINSQGGDSFDGIAVYNDLRANKAKKNVVITGIAASAASIIAMAGDHIAIADGAQILIHNAWCTVSGDAGFLERTAAGLRANSEAMVRIYSARTGIPADEIRALMDNEVLLTAQEAVDLGFADEVIGVGEQRIVRQAARMAPRQVARRMTLASDQNEVRELRRLAAEIRSVTHARYHR